MHSTIRPAIQRAKTAVEEGKHLLAERQKLIKIADRSANGWSVVAEYTADELAADEKRLEKAEKAAERKAGLKRRRKQQPAQRGAAQTPDATIHHRSSVWRLHCSSIIPPFFPTAPADCKWSGSQSAVEQEGLLGQCNVCLWVPALPVGRWGTFGCTAPRYRHKRRSGIRVSVCVWGV